MIRKLIDILDTKEPRYLNQYRPIIEKLSRKAEISTSTGQVSEQLERGKAFSNYYECYMYALSIGLNRNVRLSVDRSDSTKFLKLGSWKPRELVKYYYTSILVRSDITFHDVEIANEDRLYEFANIMVRTMEEFARGGFEEIARRLREDETCFDDITNIVLFLRESDQEISD